MRATGLRPHPIVKAERGRPCPFDLATTKNERLSFPFLLLPTCERPRSATGSGSSGSYLLLWVFTVAFWYKTSINVGEVPHVSFSAWGGAVEAAPLVSSVLAPRSHGSGPVSE